jgi:tartrate-resistant acid phosphatase type 5
MIWSDFVAGVLLDLPVDNERIGIATGNVNYVSQQILHAVRDIQELVPFYRSGHETIYGPDDLVLEGVSSVGSLPQTDQCRPLDAYYKKTGTQCVSQPLTTYSWGNRYDLVCGNPRVTNCQFFIAIDPWAKQFMTFPSVTTQHQVSLFWEGIKTSFEDDEETPFDLGVIEAVGLFVKSKIARLVDHDLNESMNYMGEYSRKRALLYSASRDRTRLSLTESSPTRGNKCANSVAVCQDVDAIVGVDVEHEDTTEFCAFGDSGDLSTIANTSAVSNLVKSLEPDFVMHMGDAVYPHGDPVLIQDELTKYYGLYIPDNFLLSYGNHDVEVDGGAALAAMLTKQDALNAGKTYYDYIHRGTATNGLNTLNTIDDVVHLFVLDTNGDVAEQAAWLQPLMEASSIWNIVVLHESPYTSDVLHAPGNTAWRLPYKTWGADLVISSHGHNYERIEVDGLTYLVCGLGGAPKRGFVDSPIAGSQFRYNTFYGCLYITARDVQLQAAFYDTKGDLVDSIAFQTPVVAP